MQPTEDRMVTELEGVTPQQRNDLEVVEVAISETDGGDPQVNNRLPPLSKAGEI